MKIKYDVDFTLRPYGKKDDIVQIEKFLANKTRKNMEIEYDTKEEYLSRRTSIISYIKYHELKDKVKVYKGDGMKVVLVKVGDTWKGGAKTDEPV